MEELLALLGLGGGGLLINEAYQGLGDAGELGYDRGTEIGQEARDGVTFKGFGVTGPTGSAQVGADGSTALNLTPEQQAFADSAQAGATGMLNSSIADTTAREADLYERIRAAQRPEEERQALALESRLASQGRTGVRTAAYGGTPEQLAMAKAIQEAKNSASVASITEARAQQAQEANMANMFGQLQYAPQSALLDLLSGGAQGYGFKDIADRQGSALFAEGATSGLDALLAARLGQANLQGQIGSSLISGSLGMLGNAIGAPYGNDGGGLFNNILKKIGLG